jgi:hypothetical protein
MPPFAGHLTIALAIAAAVTTAWSWTPSQAEPATPRAMCAALSTELGDCGCVVPFLEDHLGREETAILLELWLSGWDQDARHQTQHAASLYARHGHKVLESVTSRFLRVRTSFQMRCEPPGAHLTE